jgi:hypothetical protein
MQMKKNVKEIQYTILNRVYFYESILIRFHNINYLRFRFR